MMVVVIVGVCVVLLVLAFLFPRLSRHPERGTQGVLGLGRSGASKAPGPFGRWLAKPFSSSQRAVSKSGSAGRRTRRRLPF
jgi:hypothetical protein